MISRKILTAAVVLTAAAGPTCCLAEVVLFSHPLRTTDMAGPISNYGLPRPPVTGQQAAGFFTLPTTATIGAIRFWGTDASGNPLPLNDIRFKVRIFTAALNDRPTTKLLDVDLLADGTNVPNLLYQDRTPVVTYNATLPTPFTAQAGAGYALSVMGADPSMISYTEWNWLESVGYENSPLAGQWARSTETSPWTAVRNTLTGVTPNLAFELLAIPTPSTAAILVAGAILSGGRRRRDS